MTDVGNHDNSDRHHSPIKMHEKISNDDINRLPVATYEGPIHIVTTHKQMLTAVRRISKEKILGFDTETRPSFKKGVSYQPSLIQLAGSSDVYLFMLQSVKLSTELCQIFSNPRIIKAGVAIDRDVKELRDLHHFEPNGFIDLGNCARNKGLHHHGLRGLAALFLGCRITKGAKLTNWAQPELSKNALDYAATDAWIGRCIYIAMKKHRCLED